MTLPILKSIATLTAALIAMAGSAGTANAATLDASTAMPHLTTLTAPNQVVTVKHIFAVGYYNNESASCGIRVEYSDGTQPKNYTLTKSTTAKQFIEEKKYTLPNTYTVTVSGYKWGNYSACLGSQTSTTVIKPMEAGKITTLTTPASTVWLDSAEGIEVPFTINGEGKGCTLQVYPHNQQDPQPVMVNVEKFPVTVMIKFPHKPDDYKMLAWGTGQKACDSTAEANLKVRIKLAIPKMPTITGLFLAPVVSHNAEAWRQDEAVDFYVAGNLKNNDDPTLQCGWTLFMNGNGQSKVVTTGSKFTMGQIIPATFFSAFEPGDYTMRVKSSGADDTKANQDCKGEASQKFKLLRATATIKDVVLKAFAFHFNAASSDGDLSPGGDGGYYGGLCNNCNSWFSPAHDIGLLRISPIFAAGQTCSYSVIQKFNGQQTSRLVVYSPSDTMSGIDAMAPPKLNVYSDNKTTVLVTLVGAPGPGGPCEGTVTKAITVHDDPKMQAVTK